MNTTRSTAVRIASRSATFAAALMFSSVASAQVELRPNLKPFPAYSVHFDSSGTLLLFSTTSWNSGLGPLELLAGETNSQGQNVYQRIYLEGGGYHDYLAGTFTYHPEHQHFHFDDYALYTLQSAGAAGGSDRIGSKTTFCVMDTDQIDSSLPGAPSQPVYSSCGAFVQGMSVGWGDTYGYWLPGQSIDVTGLPDGDYKLFIEIDPKNKILETNEGDNVSCTLLRISVTRQSVTVLDPDGCNAPAVAVSGISPSTASRGSTVRVTITGSGFAPGMPVSFENGWGPRPTISSIDYSGVPSTISATVAVKRSAKPSAWDVRVGTGVLAGGFKVTP
jgi:hypothetical protein